MKRFKFLFVVGTIAVIMNNTGCGILTTASIGTNSSQQDGTVINVIIENKDDFKPEEEIAEQKSEIIFNERGYTYSIAGNSGGSIKVTDSNNILKGESGYEGEVEERGEIILQWSDAQKSLEEDKLCWLNNEFLKTYADDISFVISDDEAWELVTPRSITEINSNSLIISNNSRYSCKLKDIF